MTKKFHSICSVGTAGFLLLLCLALLAGIASAQVDQPPPVKANVPIEGNVADAMGRLKQGQFSPADVNLIAKTMGVRAAPELKEQFELTQDQVSKGSIASALVRLGDKDPAWWDYLTKEAADAIVSDAPSVARFDAKGKFVPGPSPEFIAWAKAHNRSPDSAIEGAMRDFPAKLSFLGESGDHRAIPLLRQALSSPNFMIQASAAVELARLHDKASIPLIIAACRQAPAGAAFVIAGPLSDFDDPQAQSAAKEFRPARDVK